MDARSFCGPRDMRTEVVRLETAVVVVVDGEERAGSEWPISLVRDNDVK